LVQNLRSIGYRRAATRPHLTARSRTCSGAHTERRARTVSPPNKTLAPSFSAPHLPRPAVPHGAVCPGRSRVDKNTLPHNSQHDARTFSPPHTSHTVPRQISRGNKHTPTQQHLRSVSPSHTVPRQMSRWSRLLSLTEPAGGKSRRNPRAPNPLNLTPHRMDPTAGTSRRGHQKSAKVVWSDG
jgi:hypothetical protein